MAKLIFGCGYLGLCVARRWLEQGETVYAVTRSTRRAGELARAGLEPLVADVLADTQVSLPQGVRTAVFAIGFDRALGRTIQEVYVGGLARAVEWLPDSIDRLVYISSTGVYGQSGGETVDEDSPCEPSREGGRACLAAERQLSASRLASKSIILRLAGLYGPGRIPRAADLMAGRPVDAPAAGWLNLIHVADAAQIVLLAEQRAQPPRTYVVSDGSPVRRDEYYRELARQLDAPPPVFTKPAAMAPAAQRAGSDKRVNPSRMMSELKPALMYRDYRAGLAAIVAGPGDAN